MCLSFPLAEFLAQRGVISKGTSERRVREEDCSAGTPTNREPPNLAEITEKYGQDRERLAGPPGSGDMSLS